MQKLLKPVIGGALALLLAFSVAPANALDPVAPEQPTTSVDDQTPAEENDGVDAPGDSETPEREGDPATAEDPAEDADTPAKGDEAPAAQEEPAAEGDLAEGDLTQAPEELTVGGVIAVVPNETKFDAELVAVGSHTVDEGVAGESAAELVEGGGGVFLATDEGPLLPVEAASLEGDPETGDGFNGSVEVSASAQDAIDAAIAESGGAVTRAEALQIVGEVAAAEGQELAVSGATETLPPIAGAPRSAAHGADIAFVNGGSNPGATALKNLVTGSSSYWNRQTAGAISRITPGSTVRSMSSGASKCDATTLWTQAAGQFGRSPQSYLSGSRHLVVFVRSGNCPAAGLGSLGSLHSGGLVWVDLGSSGDVAQSVGVVAHEFGHNFGLGHGQVRQCSGSTTDTSTVKSWSEYSYYRSVPKSPCKDVEYGDMSNVMGFGADLGGVKPPALSVVQKYQLGVLSAGSMKNVKSTPGKSQTFTIYPAGSDSGLRGLKINPSSGGSYFVEFRSGTGQDSALPWADGSLMSFNGNGGALPKNHVFSTGVQITKNYPGTIPSSVGGGMDLRETVITSNQSIDGFPGKYHALRAGKALTPWNSTARVRVVSIAGNQSSAKIQIDFAPFTDVPFAHKFGKEINWMYSSGLSTGTRTKSGARYEPKASVSRQAMAAFLYRMKAPKGYKVPPKSPFVDMKKGDKFYKEIVWMYTSGLSTGTMRDGKRFFDPKAPMSRAAMAAFMYRMEKPKGYKAPATSPFADVKKGQKFYREITWMHKAKLSTGTRQPSGKPRYESQSAVSREAMGAFLYRLNN